MAIGPYVVPRMKWLAQRSWPCGPGSEAALPTIQCYPIKELQTAHAPDYEGGLTWFSRHRQGSLAERRDWRPLDRRPSSIPDLPHGGDEVFDVGQQGLDSAGDPTTPSRYDDNATYLNHLTGPLCLAFGEECPARYLHKLNHLLFRLAWPPASACVTCPVGARIKTMSLDKLKWRAKAKQRRTRSSCLASTSRQGQACSWMGKFSQGQPI